MRKEETESRRNLLSHLCEFSFEGRSSFGGCSTTDPKGKSHRCERGQTSIETGLDIDAKREQRSRRIPVRIYLLSSFEGRAQRNTT